MSLRRCVLRVICRYMVREQSYKKPPEEQGFGKKIILDFLDFVRYKVESDSLTMEEADSIARTFMENVTLSATIDDLALYYGQSRNNVKVVICRKMLSKPRRRVHYSFNEFSRIVPKGWRRGYRCGEDKRPFINDLDDEG